MQDVQGLAYARGQNTGQMPTLSAQEKGRTSRLCQIITRYVRRHQKGLAAMQRLESKKEGWQICDRNGSTQPQSQDAGKPRDAFAHAIAQKRRSFDRPVSERHATRQPHTCSDDVDAVAYVRWSAVHGTY